MQTEKILIVILVGAALAGLAWTISGFSQGSSHSARLVNTPQNFNQALPAELADICQTPEGYTDEEWLEHMSHHPDRYQECFTGKDTKSLFDYKNIGPDDLAAMLKQKDFWLIDTHIPEQAHIPGTDRFIPFNEIESRRAELPPDRNAKIVLYCRSGSMSRTAAETLLDLGYTNVYNLAGGVNGWLQEGFEVDPASLK